MAKYGNILDCYGFRRPTEPQVEVRGVEYVNSTSGVTTLRLQLGQNVEENNFPSTPTHKPVTEYGATARSYGKYDDKGNPE
jgi:hypothetical protein